jgi:hypothetical protein
LPLAPGIECRNAGANGSHEAVFKFALPVTFQGASATPEAGQTAELDGPPVASPDGKEVTVKLRNVTNAQRLFVQLLDVNDGTNTANVSMPMGVLLGDTTANGTVNTSDIGQAKASPGQPATESNFRRDVTVNGTINSSDIR